MFSSSKRVLLLVACQASLYLLCIAFLHKYRSSRHLLNSSLGLDDQYVVNRRHGDSNSVKRRSRTLISYAYSERPGIKGSHGDDNLRFFLNHGVRVYASTSVANKVQYVVILNGVQICPDAEAQNYNITTKSTYPSSKDGNVSRLSKIGDGNGVCGLLQVAVDCCGLIVLRRPNVGFDFGAHNAMLRSSAVIISEYDYFIFLNAGVRGPFIPPALDNADMREEWHWSMAFTNRLKGNTRIVGTSIVCIGKKDPCFAVARRNCTGPNVEGFAFALDSFALRKIMAAGTVFYPHPDKISAILDGEYGMNTIVRREGWQMDCLLSAYRGINWMDRKNWNCNANRHPSRSGTYFGMSMHPYETIFHKSQWAGESPVSEQTEELFTKWQNAGFAP